ncbi:hypothetical protein [Enterobacter bugandensis]|uniref:hypothetical protein n=1 Tax=Enterobacter bugandensis TaxID=881260 RepID=UPI0023614F0E|nr:hypothetical protein [Enterobacter bugandensis]
MTIDATSGAAPAPSPSAPDSPGKNISLLAQTIRGVCNATGLTPLAGALSRTTLPASPGELVSNVLNNTATVSGKLLSTGALGAAAPVVAAIGTGAAYLKQKISGDSSPEHPVLSLLPEELLTFAASAADESARPSLSSGTQMPQHLFRSEVSSGATNKDLFWQDTNDMNFPGAGTLDTLSSRRMADAPLRLEPGQETVLLTQKLHPETGDINAEAFSSDVLPERAENPVSLSAPALSDPDISAGDKRSDFRPPAAGPGEGMLPTLSDMTGAVDSLVTRVMAPGLSFGVTAEDPPENVAPDELQVRENTSPLASATNMVHVHISELCGKRDNANLHYLNEIQTNLTFALHFHPKKIHEIIVRDCNFRPEQDPVNEKTLLNELSCKWESVNRHNQAEINHLEDNVIFFHSIPDSIKFSEKDRLLSLVYDNTGKPLPSLHINPDEWTEESQELREQGALVKERFSKAEAAQMQLNNKKHIQSQLVYCNNLNTNTIRNTLSLNSLIDEGAKNIDRDKTLNKKIADDIRNTLIDARLNKETLPQGLNDSYESLLLAKHKVNTEMSLFIEKQKRGLNNKIERYSNPIYGNDFVGLSANEICDKVTAKGSKATA